MNITNSQFIKSYTTLIAKEEKKKKLFKRVKIDIITYSCVESKFCRRFQDSKILKFEAKKKLKNI